MNNEKVITCDGSGQSFNCSIWDYSTGISLKSFNGGVSGFHTLATVGNDYLISADSTKPLVYVWPLNRRDQQATRFVTPGRLVALTVTPDGTFCIGAISDRIYIWKICTGDLLTTISIHYQPVSCLRTTDDGDYLISAGEDTFVYVWKLATLLNSVTSASSTDSVLYKWSHHSLPVKDLFVGKGGRRAKCATVSTDQTCRLYRLSSGDLLLTVVMDIGLTAVTMDSAEFFVFVGGIDGRIFQISLVEPPATVEHHFSTGTSHGNVFIGHSKQITALVVSLDGNTLISGSSDSTAKIWNISSKQCLRSLAHKGPVMNVLLIPTLDVMRRMNISAPKPCLTIKSFKNYICTSHVHGNSWKHVADVCPAKEMEMNFSFGDCRMDSYEENREEAEEIRKLTEEVEELRKLNGAVFEKKLEEILLSPPSKEESKACKRKVK